MPPASETLYLRPAPHGRSARHRHNPPRRPNLPPRPGWRAGASNSGRARHCASGHGRIRHVEIGQAEARDAGHETARRWRRRSRCRAMHQRDLFILRHGRQRMSARWSGSSAGFVQGRLAAQPGPVRQGPGAGGVGLAVWVGGVGGAGAAAVSGQHRKHEQNQAGGQKRRSRERAHRNCQTSGIGASGIGRNGQPVIAGQPEQAMPR